MATYNTDNNTNPGFATGNNQTGQSGGMSVSQNGFNFNDWLMKVAQQLGTPQNSSGTQGGMAVAQPQQVQLNPYQEGVKKALKQVGEAHTVEAIQMGVPADHIVQQSGLTPQDNQQQDPTQLLAGLLSLGSQTQQNSQQNQTPIQQQAMNAIQPSTGPLGKFFDMIGATNAVRGSQLENLSKAQEIMGQTPSQQYPLALTAQVKQEMSGQKPIQPGEQLSAQTAAQQKQIETINSQITAEKASLDSNLKEYATAASNPIAQLRGGQSLKDLHSAIESSRNRIGMMQKKLDNISTNYSQKTGASSSNDTQNLANKIKVGQVINVGGAKVKRIN